MVSRGTSILMRLARAPLIQIPCWKVLTTASRKGINNTLRLHPTPDLLRVPLQDGSIPAENRSKRRTGTEPEAFRHGDRKEAHIVNHEACLPWFIYLFIIQNKNTRVYRKAKNFDCIWLNLNLRPPPTPPPPKICAGTLVRTLAPNALCDVNKTSNTNLSCI